MVSIDCDTTLYSIHVPILEEEEPEMDPFIIV